MEEIKKDAIIILIPTYNCAEYLPTCLDSILAQTYEFFKVVIFDDRSTDGTDKIVQEYADKNPGKIFNIKNWGEKRWNGGARNKLIAELPRLGLDAEYILFMDGDDRFVDNTVLQRVWDFTIDHAVPDVVRLGYIKKFANHTTKVIIGDSTPAEMAANPRVAPWTKLLRKKLFVPFPENTLFEDVSQHIAQADVVETVASTDFPVIEWNRCNPKSVSTGISPKRKSSAFRFVADLMDLELNNDYAKERRDFKIRDAANNLGMDFDKIDWKKVCC